MDKQIFELNKKYARQRTLKRIIALLCVFVMLFTVNSLKMVALTLTRKPMCGLKNHLHKASCYDSAGNLICGKVEHQHTDACYQEAPPIEVDLAEDLVLDTNTPTDNLDLDLDAGDLVLDDGQVAQAPAAEDNKVETPSYKLGSKALLSKIIRETGLKIKLKKIKEVGIVDNDGSQVGLVEIKKQKDGDYRIKALRDFARVELAIVLADEVVVVELVDGVGTSSGATMKNSKKAAKQTEVGGLTRNEAEIEQPEPTEQPAAPAEEAEVVIEEQQPAGEEQPAATVEEEAGAVIEEQQPAATVEEEAGVVVEDEQPIVEEQPAATVEEEAGVVIEEQQSAEQPAATVEEEAGVVVEEQQPTEQPAATIEEEAGVVVEDEQPIVEEQPAEAQTAPTVEEPQAAVEEMQIETPAVEDVQVEQAADEQIEVTDVDATGSTTFEGIKTIANRKFMAGDTLSVSIASTNDGEATINDLLPGTYQLTETSAPTGYILTLKTITFTVDTDGNVTYNTTTGDNASNSNMVTYTAKNSEQNTQATFTISNEKGAALPATGGPGTTLFYAAGAAMVLLALALLVRRKRNYD